MHEPANILIVDDDAAFACSLDGQLKARGFAVAAAANGAAALGRVRLDRPDLILLDIDLPGMDGFEVCEKLQELTSAPIIFVTSHDDASARAAAWRNGGVDYVVKPVRVGDLVQRIHRALADPDSPAFNSRVRGIVELGSTSVDLANASIKRRGKPIDLTPVEWVLLRKLIEHRGHAVSLQTLARAIGISCPQDASTVHIHVCRLRRKLEEGILDAKQILGLPDGNYLLRN